MSTVSRALAAAKALGGVPPSVAAAYALGFEAGATEVSRTNSLGVETGVACIFSS